MENPISFRNKDLVYGTVNLLKLCSGQDRKKTAYALMAVAGTVLDGPIETRHFWDLIMGFSNMSFGFFPCCINIPNGLRINDMPVKGQDGDKVSYGFGPSFLSTKVVPKQLNYLKCWGNNNLIISFPFQNSSFPQMYLRVSVETSDFDGGDGKRLSFLLSPDGKCLDPLLVPIIALKEDRSKENSGMLQSFQVMLNAAVALGIKR